MRVDKTRFVIALIIAVLSAYTYKSWGRAIFERITVMRGQNLLPPAPTISLNTLPVHKFDDILINIKSVVYHRYVLERDFYEPARLAQFLAVSPEAGMVFQNRRGLQIRSDLRRDVLTFPVSTVGTTTVQFVAQYHESFAGKVEASGNFFFPEGGPVHFADIVSAFGYNFNASEMKVFDGEQPTRGLFGNGQIIYDIETFGPFDATISASFHPDGSLMSLGYKETMR